MRKINTSIIVPAMIRVIIALQAGCLLTPVAHASLYFYDDFESGSFDEWDAPYCQYRSNTTIISISTDAAKKGSYSFKAEDADAAMHGAGVYKYFGLDNFYFRFYVNFRTGFFSQFTSGQLRYLVIISGAGGTSINMTASKSGTDNRISLTGTPFSGVQENTWYCIEIRVPPCTSGAVLKWWIDGVEQASGTHDYGAVGSWESIMMGVGWASAGAILQAVYYDEIIMADSYIGPISGTPYPGNFRLERQMYTVNEANGTASIKVKRIGGSAGVVSVHYATSDGTAVSGADYTGVSGDLNWPDADSADKAINIPVINDSQAENSETINLTLSSPAVGTNLVNITSSTIYIIDNDSADNMSPNPIISRGKPVYGSADTANVSKAVDGLYSDSDSGRWSPGNVPAWVAVNVSSGYSRLLFAWNSTGILADPVNWIYVNYDYGSTFYGPRDYTIQTSADSANGSDGTWQTVATVTANGYRTREHSFDFTGKKWVKMYITAVTSTTWGIDEIDIHDASNGCSDSMFFAGDSIAARAFRRTADRVPGYADDIHAKYSSYYPAMLNGGIGGWSAAAWKNIIDDVLLINPDMKYWCIGLGTNDITWNCNTSTSFYRKALQYMIDKIKIAGRIPVIQTISYNASNPSNLSYRVPDFNQVVDDLTNENGLIPGPDLYTALSSHPEYFEDSAHPNGTGSIAINQQWANALDLIYIRDTTPPGNITVIRDGTGADTDYMYSTTELSANWDSSADSESGINRYWYAAGSSQGGTNIVNWTNNGNATTVTKTGLTLTVGTTYYFSVKAENGVGLQSSTTTSNGQFVTANSSGTVLIPSALAYPNPCDFKEGRVIKFGVRSSETGEVRIYTMSGKLVRELRRASGAGDEIKWDGTNEDGEKVSKGIYFYKIIDSNGDTVAGKLAITKN